MPKASDSSRLHAARQKAKQVVAVGFDSRMLRIAAAQVQGKGVRLTRLADTPLPQDIDVKDAQALGAFVGQSLSSLGLHNDPVLMLLPRSQVILKPLTLPKAPDEGALAGMVQFQVAKELPFAAADAVIDFAIETHYDAEDGAIAVDDEPTTSVLVAAARRSVVSFHQQLAEAAGVKLLRLSMRSYANLTALRACQDERGQRADCQAVVHITSDETQVDVLVDGDLGFSRSTLLNVSAEEASLERSVASVVAEINRSLRSYQAVQRGRRFDEIVIAGGTGVEQRVAEDLEKKLGVPCRLFDPTRSLRLGEQVDNASSFISVIGLALGHVDERALPVDFLTPRQPRAPRNPKRRLIALAASGVAALLLLSVGFGGYNLYVKSSERDTLLREVNELKREAKSTVNPRLKRHRALENWLDGAQPWLDHWAYLSSLFPEATQAYIGSFKTVGSDRMQFTLYARSAAVIEQVVERLTNAGYQVRPGSQSTEENEYGYGFETSLTVIIPDNFDVSKIAIEPASRPEDDDSAARLRKAEGRRSR